MFLRKYMYSPAQTMLFFGPAVIGLTTLKF